MINFRSFMRNASHLLSMNQRNLLCIYPLNKRKFFPMADNKIMTKSLLVNKDILLPETYKIYGSFYELSSLEKDLSGISSFVIKPARGSGGGGIIPIAGKRSDTWYSVGGRQFDLSDLRRHISDIIFGVYSFDLYDNAIIEERIEQHHSMEDLSPLGLADVRLIIRRGRILMAMVRIPTSKSEGKANLHQGAIGAGIELNSGIIHHAVLNRVPTREHPDTAMDLIGRKVPLWEEIKSAGVKAASALPLKYVGIDIAVADKGPVLLEVNARPGLDIQNANIKGLRGVIEGSISPITEDGHVRQ